MEIIGYNKDDAILDEEIKDYVDDSLKNDELHIYEMMMKRKLVLIGLASVYICLILISFTIVE